MDDDKFLKEMEGIYQKHSMDWEYEYVMGLFYLERDDCVAARDSLYQ